MTLCLILSLDIRRQWQSLDAELSSTAGYIAGMEQIPTMLDSGCPNPEAGGRHQLCRRGHLQLDTDPGEGTLFTVTFTWTQEEG